MKGCEQEKTCEFTNQCKNCSCLIGRDGTPVKLAGETVPAYDKRRAEWIKRNNWSNQYANL